MAETRFQGIPIGELPILAVDWTYRAEHIRTRSVRQPGDFDVEPGWATEAALDPDRLVDVASEGSVVVLGFSQQVERVLKGLPRPEGGTMMRDIRKELAEVADLAERTKDDRLRRFGRPPKPHGEVGQVYSIRIPVAQIVELERFAAQEHQAPRTMLRKWVLERLANETRKARPPRVEAVRPLTRRRRVR